MTNRLKRYRAFNERLWLTNPGSAIRQGLYIKPPGLTAADEVVGHMEPAPTSTIALVGGIGAGKTTELLIAAERLSKVEETRALYIDVSELHDLDNIEPGVLVAAVGVQLCQEIELRIGRRVQLLPRKAENTALSEQHAQLPKLPDETSRTLRKQAEWFRQWAETREEWVDDPDFYPPPEDDSPKIYAVVPGKLSLPHRLDKSLQGALSVLKSFRAHLPEPNRYLVAMLDSLDRVSNMEMFTRGIESDLRILKMADIGVVLTAPLLSLYGKYRPILERFDHVVHLPPSDVEADPESLSFLDNILAARDPQAILPSRIRTQLALLSGGVLRDMLTLAGDAAKQAYMAGCDSVEDSHVQAAAFQLGRTRWFGLNSNDIAVLRRIQAKGLFAPATDSELALLMTRRLLEYPQVGKQPRFAVHPVVSQLLSQSAEAS